MGLTIEKTVRSDHMDVLKILYPFVVRMIRKNIPFFTRRMTLIYLVTRDFFILVMTAIIY